MEIDQIVQIIFLIAIGMLVLIVVVLFTMYSSGRKIYREKMKREQLEVAHKRELLAHTLKTQENERKRFSSEIHDGVSSKLSVIGMQLNRLGKSIDAKWEPDLESIRALLLSTTEETRRISQDLFPVILEKFGLITAVEELCETTSSNEVKIDLRTSMQDEDFDKRTATHAYRILQEFINNSLKHAQCSEIAVTLEQDGEEVCLIYRDNGIGTIDALQRKAGMGLLNIRSRLDALNGRLETDNGNPGLVFTLRFQRVQP